MEGENEAQLRCKACQSILAPGSQCLKHIFIDKGGLVKGFLLDPLVIGNLTGIRIDDQQCFAVESCFDKEVIFQFALCASCSQPVGKYYLTRNIRMKVAFKKIFIFNDCANQGSDSRETPQQAEANTSHLPKKQDTRPERAHTVSQIGSFALPFEGLLEQTEGLLFDQEALLKLVPDQGSVHNLSHEQQAAREATICELGACLRDRLALTSQLAASLERSKETVLAAQQLYKLLIGWLNQVKGGGLPRTTAN